MGVKTTSKVWEWSESTGTNRLVMLALSDFCDDHDECFPGVARIAKKCRISERTAQRSFRELEAMGELEVLEKLGMKTNGGATNRFKLNLKGGDKSGNREKKGGDTGGQKVVTSGAKGGDTAMSPESSGEPSVKPSEVSKEKKRTLSKATLEEVEAFTLSLGLTTKDGEFMFYNFEEKGWGKNWKMAVQKWKSAGWLPSQKEASRLQQPSFPSTGSKKIFTAEDHMRAMGIE
jgi:hypothetical protein